MNDLDSRLRSADPARGRTAGARALVAALGEEVTAQTPPARTAPWRSPRFAIPAAVGLGLALTAAAVIVPLTLSIDGRMVDADVAIPIEYTTETGVRVTCEYGLYVGDPQSRTPADDALTAFLRDEDWSGIGQEIYEEAMAEPFVPGPNDDWQVDTQQARDWESFNRATHVIYDRVPAALTPDGTNLSSTTTCSGQLR